MQKDIMTGPDLKDHNVTIHEYDADHWSIFSHAKEISADLDEWLTKVVA